MQPNQPSPGNQPPQTPIPEPKQPADPYGFIFSEPQPPKKSLNLGGGFKKLPIIIGGALGVIMLVVVLIALLSGGNSGPTVQLAGLAADQQEIIRVSDIALKTSKDSTTLARATTIKASVSSEQKKALELLSTQGGKLEKGQLNTKLNKKTDEQLNSAAQSGTFDKAYNEYLAKSLASYKNKLKVVYDAGGQKTKAFANQAFSSTDLVLSRM